MKVVCLISGGKDSCFNMMHCVALNHQIVALANLYPSKKGESDSYMYQTVGCEAISIYSEAMQLPLFKREIRGTSKEIDLVYQENKADEVEDLFCLLQSIKEEIQYEGVSCGAILSDYQRIRVENVCSRLGLVSLSYLWRQDQTKLLQDMINYGVNAILIKTAALGLVPKLHLGKSLQEMKPHLLTLNSKYGSHVCGEGGEYETFTLDCPLFKKRIVVDDSEIILHSDDGITSVGYLHLKSLHLQDKHDFAFDYSMLVPKLVLPEKAIYAENGNQTSNNSLTWKFPSYKMENEELLPSLSVYSDQSCLCVSNHIATCLSYEEEDIIRATKKAFRDLAEILQKYQHVFSDVVKVHIWLADMAHFSVINSVYKTYFQLNPPVRVCVTSCVDDPDVRNYKLLFGMDCISRANSSASIKTMHVQGISHWAPANIGPYSQSKLSKHYCYVAGQIGLVPGTMALIEGGIEAEAQLSLQHVKNVLLAMDPNLCLRHTHYCICYVTSDSYLHVVKSLWEKEVDEDLHKKIVYVTIPSLPRGCRVEWEVVAIRNTNKATTSSTVIFHHFTCFDFVDCVKTLLTLCEERNAVMPSQVRIFYSKHNSSFCHLQGVINTLQSSLNRRPSIAFLPVQSVHEHFCSVASAIALVCSFSNDVVNLTSQNQSDNEQNEHYA